MEESMNEFNGGAMVQYQRNETAATAAAETSRALVESRYMMAIKRPRDMDQFRGKLLTACERTGFAEVAWYNKPIGKGVRGPSIRLAEAAARYMGNIHCTTSTVFDDRERRILHVEVTDLETNVPFGQDVTVTKTVERRNKKDGDTVVSQRLNSTGQTVYILEANDDDILNKQNALISKCLRTLILRLVPGDIIDECENKIQKTLGQRDAQDPDSARKRLFDSFAGVGVEPVELKKFIGHDGPLSPKELQSLRETFSALKDRETTWREVMDSVSEKPTQNTGAMFGSAPAAPAPAPTAPAPAPAPVISPDAPTMPNPSTMTVLPDSKFGVYGKMTPAERKDALIEKLMAANCLDAVDWFRATKKLVPDAGIGDLSDFHVVSVLNGWDTWLKTVEIWRQKNAAKNGGAK
jgi:hypothetical protein